MKERRNDEVLTRIDTTLQIFKKNTENHLTKLNGQVIKNTSFRNKAMGGFAVISFVGIGSLVGIVLLWLSIFNNNDLSQRLSEMEGYFDNAEIIQE